MPKHVAVCLDQNNSAYDDLLIAREGKPYDHHYESHLDWQADQAAIGANTTLYGGLLVEQYHDWPTGLTQFGTNTITGWTCDHTTKTGIIVRPAPGHRHDGTFGVGGIFTGATLVQTEYQRNLFALNLSRSTGYFRVEGLCMSCTQTRGAGVYSSATQGVELMEIDGCLFEKFGSTGAIDVRTEGSDRVIVNNIVRDCVNYGIYTGYRGNVFVYNNTVQGCGSGIWIERSNSTLIAEIINNVCTGSGNVDFNETGTAGSVTAQNNISGDGTSTIWGGAGNEINQSIAFYNLANGDLHLDPSDTGAQGKGQDLSGASFYPFDYDIDNDQRADPWDCGADQIAGAPPTPAGGGSLLFGKVI